MSEVSLVSFIYILFLIIFSIYAAYIALPVFVLRSHNDPVQEHSHIILLNHNDKRQIPTLSVLSSHVYNERHNENDFLMLCRQEYANDQRALSEIYKFELDNSLEKIINWYTRGTFVHQVINKVLHSGSMTMIHRYQFIIRNLHRQLSALHYSKYQRDVVQPPQVYYRGMSLSTQDLNKLIVDNLITFETFTSASLSREVAMMFAGNALIEIEIKNRTGLYGIFHPISDLSHFKDEEEILFSIGNVFRVEKVQWSTKKSIWEVKLALQKHLLHRSNFGVESANSPNQKFIYRIWKRLIQLSAKTFIYIFKSYTRADSKYKRS